MPRGITKFQAKWLDCMDTNGEPINNWCSKGKNDYQAQCLVCNCCFSIANGGMSQIMQHASKKKHTNNSEKLKGQATLVGRRCFENQASNSNSRTLSVNFNTEQLITRAEALWVMKVAVSNFSFASCKDVVSLFQTMFDGHSIANSMRLSERKVSYVLSHGIGPFFLQQTVKDLKAAINLDCWFCLAFDETTTSQVKKQLDVYVRYWSPSSKSVVCSYLNSIFLGHATSDTVCSSLIESLSVHDLPLSKLLMLSMDGPNVNLAVAKKLNEEIVKLGAPEPINLGTCSLHKVHNCFSKALDSLPLDIDQFATDLFNFFKLSAARKEDLKSIESLFECEEKFLLRHVNSRWITLGPVVDRILSVYPALKEYFLNFLPKQKQGWKSLQINSRYLRIISSLKDNSTPVFLEFVSAVTTILQRYLTLFQKEGPLIHILYNKMNELVRNIMKKFLKEKYVADYEGKKLLSIDINKFENYRNLKNLDVGSGTIRALSSLSENEAKTSRLAMRKCLIELTSHLKESLPIACEFLCDLEKLNPLMRKEQTDNAIRRLCVKMKPLKFKDFMIDRIVHEWQIYRLDPEIDSLCANYKTVKVMSDEDQKGVEKVSYQRIDKFWQNVFEISDKYTGNFKYSNLAKLVKCCLSLPHGNSDVERGFSINNALLSKDRPNLSENVVIGIRAVKDAVQRYGGVLNVPITGKLLRSVTMAHSTYMLEKQEQQRMLEDKKRKRIQEKEEEEKASLVKRHKEEVTLKITKLDEAIKLQKNSLTAAQSILNQGSEKLQSSIKAKNFEEMRIASVMIETSNKKIQELTAELNKLQEDKLKLQNDKCTI